MIADPPITPMTVPILAPVFIPPLDGIFTADDVGTAVREPVELIITAVAVVTDIKEESLVLDIIVAAFVVDEVDPVRVVNGTVLACTRAPSRKPSFPEQQL